MDVKRLAELKEVLKMDFSERHDVPQFFFSVDDLKQLIEQAEKADCYEESLREIDNHIRSTKWPISHIIGTLKRTLPEYE